ncbi:baseplate assembly protein [Rhizobium sp. YJ-22]|uniref:baseplate J/gp47 family protein n=1 Tax=Rhizobium sp. YJ-22 TaxID=3037556 RepID=UPI0024124BE0|nr:baseplate J/gp47 family protein [Rhizobium sp. YJ-22]MDG3580419.1 baseplate assembly protein [Rhizobium sp. YJ-22]
MTIDLTRLRRPDVLETVNQPAMLDAAIARFIVEWNAQRAKDPALPAYTTEMIKGETAVGLLRAWTLERTVDRERVNDAIEALLAVRAHNADLENLVAGRNIERIVIRPATADTPAVLESDASLLRRYLASFDKAAPGSANRYLYEAWAAWPQNDDKTLGLWDAAVNGFDIHGRRGDDDIVIIGPAGRLPTEEERLLIRAAVTNPSIKPNAISISVLPAIRAEYHASFVVELPTGPDPAIVVAEAETRVRAAAIERTMIGGEVPAGLLAGAAYGPSVIKVRDLAPVVISPDPYTVPVLTGLTIVPEVRS